MAKGEEIVITKHEKPMARLIPVGRQDLSDIREAVEDYHVDRTDVEAG